MWLEAPGPGCRQHPGEGAPRGRLRQKLGRQLEGPLFDLVVLMLMGGFLWAIQGFLWRKIRAVGIDDVA